VLIEKLSKVNFPLKPFDSSTLKEIANEMQKAVTNWLNFRSGDKCSDEWK
jgi:hypothetical protein